MKKLLLSLAVCTYVLAATAQDKTAPLSAVVGKIARCWQDADQANKSGITLKSVTASFAVSKTTTIGGEIKIWVFKLGKKIEKTRVSKLTLEMTKGSEDKINLKGTEKKEDLTKFISAALADFQKLDEMGVLPDLPERELTLEIGLTINNSNTIGGEVEIGIFSLSAEAGKNAEQANTLTLVFSKKKSK